MTVLAAEEGATVAAGGESAAGGTAARTRAARPSRGATGSRGPQGRQGPAAQAPAGSQRKSSGKRKGSGGRLSGTRNYQPAILVEFLTAIILVSATPFATTKQPEGLSPYAGQDVVKLTAITFTYLLLALLSAAGPKAGKFAALFGLLILLTVGLNEAANLVVAFDLFAGIPVVSGKKGASK